MQPSRFMGRVGGRLVGLVRVHRLVTLTGTVAGELIPEFPDGVWLVELAAVGEPAAPPEAVAAAFGVIPQARGSVTDSIALALSGRRLLIELDNCEDVLDASAERVQTILARTTTMRIVATSTGGLAGTVADPGARRCRDQPRGARPADPCSARTVAGRETRVGESTGQLTQAIVVRRRRKSITDRRRGVARQSPGVTHEGCHESRCPEMSRRADRSSWCRPRGLSGLTR